MKFGFIGCGNMGGAVARAVCKGAGAENVWLANRTPAKAQALASELGCHVCGNRELANQCDFIFLGVKPQMMADLLDDLAPVLECRAEDRPFVLVSMAMVRYLFMKLLMQYVSVPVKEATMLYNTLNTLSIFTICI